MYTVEMIEDNIVTLEDRLSNKLFNIEKNKLPKDIKEGDILNKINNKYIIDLEETKRIKSNIKNRFNSLKN